MNRRELFQIAVGTPLAALAGGQAVASEPKEVLFRVAIEQDAERAARNICRAVDEAVKDCERRIRERVEQQLRDMKRECCA